MYTLHTSEHSLKDPHAAPYSQKEIPFLDSKHLEVFELTPLYCHQWWHLKMSRPVHLVLQQTSQLLHPGLSHMSTSVCIPALAFLIQCSMVSPFYLLQTLLDPWSLDGQFSCSQQSTPWSACMHDSLWHDGIHQRSEDLLVIILCNCGVKDWEKSLQSSPKYCCHWILFPIFFCPRSRLPSRQHNAAPSDLCVCQSPWLAGWLKELRKIKRY